MEIIDEFLKLIRVVKANGYTIYPKILLHVIALGADWFDGLGGMHHIIC